MYSREALTDIFQKVLQFEEDVKVLYDDCIDNLEDELKYYKWLSEDKRERVANIMKKLGGDSQRHKSMVENLIQNVGESKKNVF